jgi:transcriptional regulator with XRE-family HTH domain
MAKKHHNLRGMFGNTVLTYRKRAGLSAEELANKLGVNRKTIVAWENDRRLPYPSNWTKLLQWAQGCESVGETGANALMRAYAKALTEYTENNDGSGVYIGDTFAGDE